MVSIIKLDQFPCDPDQSVNLLKSSFSSAAGSDLNVFLINHWMNE